MAALAPPFILCPISEVKDLLGFSDAGENNVIMTLGKNIAIKYSVLEQKQESSWTSSSHWFTSKVVYCRDLEKYAAVMDDTMVCSWEENDANLLLVKKFKLSQKLQQVLPTDAFGSLLIFKNGLVKPLSQVSMTGNQKFPAAAGDFNEQQNSILDVSVNESKSLIFIVTGNNRAGGKPLSKIGVERQKEMAIFVSDLSGSRPQLVSTVKISPEDGTDIMGWCVVATDLDTSIVYLCSNGSLWSRLLESKGNKNVQSDSFKISAFAKHVSIDNPVVLQSYDESTIVCYGSSPNEEGAVVFLYDLKYDLILSKQAIKLYNIPPVMTKVNNNVLIPSGLNVLVVGIRVARSLLSSVVGRNQIQGLDFFECRDPWKGGWEQKDGIQPLDKCTLVEDLHEMSSYDGIDLVDLQDIVNTLEKNGHPEASICANVIPQALEKGDATALKWILEYFEDIPEAYLVQLIPPAVKLYKQSSEKSESSSTGGEEVFLTVLDRTFDGPEMVRSLKRLSNEDLRSFLSLLNDIMSRTALICEDGKIEEDARMLKKIMVWISVVLDAHYTNLVFTGETELVNSMLKNINERIALMKEIESLGPLVAMIVNKTNFAPRPNPNSIYRVETVIFR